MPPRASWKGSLKLSLVSFPIRLYNAVSSTARIALNQLHQPDYRRIRYQVTCPEHGEVPRSEIVRGYEYEKGRYVVIEDEDLARIRLETTHAVELTRFVPGEALDPLYLDTAYYVAPDGKIAEGAFQVIREAMQESGRVGVGRVVLGGREVSVALGVKDRGFVLHSLHYAEEVRTPEPYFADIPDQPVDRDEVALARELIDRISGPFDPSAFTDRYQQALLEVVKAKVKGEAVVIEPREESAKVVNLMDALRRSLQKTGADAAADEVVETRKPAAASVRTPRRGGSRKRSS
jgi:DNA end-binding protein Ku